MPFDAKTSVLIDSADYNQCDVLIVIRACCLLRANVCWFLFYLFIQEGKRVVQLCLCLITLTRYFTSVHSCHSDWDISFCV